MNRSEAISILLAEDWPMPSPQCDEAARMGADALNRLAALEQENERLRAELRGPRLDVEMAQVHQERMDEALRESRAKFAQAMDALNLSIAQENELFARLATARDEALEEAAELVLEHEGDFSGIPLYNRILALKSKRG